MNRHIILLGLSLIFVAQLAFSQSKAVANENSCTSDARHYSKIKNIGSVDIQNQTIQFDLDDIIINVCAGDESVKVNNITDDESIHLSCTEIANKINDGVGYNPNGSGKGLWFVVHHNIEGADGKVQMGITNDPKDTWLVTTYICPPTQNDDVANTSNDTDTSVLISSSTSEVTDGNDTHLSKKKEDIAASKKSNDICTGRRRDVLKIANTDSVDIENNPVLYKIGRSDITVCVTDENIIIHNVTDDSIRKIHCDELSGADAKFNNGIGYDTLNNDSGTHLWFFMNHGPENKRKIQIGLIKTVVIDGKKEQESNPWIVTTSKC